MTENPSDPIDEGLELLLACVQDEDSMAASLNAISHLKGELAEMALSRLVNYVSKLKLMSEEEEVPSESFPRRTIVSSMTTIAHLMNAVYGAPEERISIDIREIKTLLLTFLEGGLPQSIPVPEEEKNNPSVSKSQSIPEIPNVLKHRINHLGDKK